MKRRNTSRFLIALIISLFIAPLGFAQEGRRLDGNITVNGPLTVDGLETPSGLAVTVQGTAGATTYTYRVVARNAAGAATAAAAAVSVTTGNATLTTTNSNRIVWDQVPGATDYQVYRTVGGATQGIIATATYPTRSIIDSGLAGGGETAPEVSAVAALTVTGSYSTTVDDPGVTATVMTLVRTTASPADNDAMNLILRQEDDNNENDIDATMRQVATDVSDSTEDSEIRFLAMKAGTSTEILRVDPVLNGILVGDGAATGVVSSRGSFDTIIQTGNGTTGTITIVDGAAGAITLAPNGTGDVNVDADTLRVGDAAADATITSNGAGDLILNTNGGTTTGSITIADAANGNISLTPNGSGAVVLANTGARLQGFNALSPRYELKWVAGQRGKPSINADIQNAAEGTREIADPDFEVLGGNASSDDVTFYVEGGVSFQTDGGGTDSVILLPHLDANQSAWAQITWGTDKSTVWEADISTTADITGCVIWAGLKLTNTDVVATDNDQVYFRYLASENGGEWQAVSSIAGVDTATDTNVVVATTTRYHLKVAIDSSRVARFYINGVLVSTTAALTNAVDLIPYIGVLETGVEVEDLTIHGQAISRVIG